MGKVRRFLDALDQRCFVGTPPLEPGEVVLWSAQMGHLWEGVARGGVLYVTTSRVVFQPNRLERRRGRATLAWARHAIRQIDPVEAPISVRGLGGAFMLKTDSGDVAEFTAYGPGRTVNDLRTLVLGSYFTGQE